MSNLQYYENKLNEMPKDVVLKAVNFLKEFIPTDEINYIRQEVSTKGLIEWCTELHFGWGMYIRNVLRSKAKLNDDLLPDENWDDYYIQCIEIAADKRPYKFD